MPYACAGPVKLKKPRTVKKNSALEKMLLLLAGWRRGMKRSSKKMLSERDSHPNLCVTDDRSPRYRRFDVGYGFVDTKNATRIAVLTEAYQLLFECAQNHRRSTRWEHSSTSARKQ